MEFIKVGRIVNTFGIKGELKVKSFTDFPELRFAKEATVYLEQKEELIIENHRIHKNMHLIKLKDLDNINDVLKYKDHDLYIKKSQTTKLPAGEYYFYELKDLEVYDKNNNFLGIVKNVESGLANNVLRIKQEDGKEFLVPYVKSFIKDVNLTKKKIIIHVIEGLL